MNFFDGRLSQLKNFGADIVIQSYYALFPYKKSTETVYCYFDENQELLQWESFIDRLLRMDDVQVYIIGSFVQMLSREIGTQMRSRA